MGWCSGTDVFDKMYEHILKLGKADTVGIVKALQDLIEVLHDNDWDCESDSKYWNRMCTLQARYNLNPSIEEREELDKQRDKIIYKVLKEN